MSIDPKHRLFLAIDQGGHASRAFVFDAKGAVLAKASCTLKTNRPLALRVEHDAEDLIASIKGAINHAVSQLGENQDRLYAAGLATQRASVVCWNRKNRQALSKVISWQDRRAAGWMESLGLDSAELHRRTGLFPSAHYGASKLRWCLEHLPAVQSALQKGELAMGPLASFIIACLTEEGQAYADPANASRTLLWNILACNWDDHLLKTFQIPTNVLPLCVPSRHPYGHIALSKRRLPLSFVTGDQSAALFHDGKPKKNAIYLNLGTGAFLQRLQKQSPQTERLLSSLVLCEDGECVYALEGTINGAGAALAWFSDQYQADKWFESAEDWLKKTLAPPLFINAIGGLASPYWMPRLSSGFIGGGDLAARLTAVIESILFLIQVNLEEMGKVTAPPTQLIVSGGLSAIDGLCQRLANLSGILVVRSEDCDATARGLAFLMAKPSTSWSTDLKILQFFQEEDKGLKSRYALWQQEIEKAIAEENQL